MTSSYGGSAYSASIAPHESLKNSYMTRSIAPSLTKEMSRDDSNPTPVSHVQPFSMSCTDQCFTTLGCHRWLSADVRNKQTGLKLQDAMKTFNSLLEENTKNRVNAENEMVNSSAKFELLKQELIKMNSISVIDHNYNLVSSRDKALTPSIYKLHVYKIRSEFETLKRCDKRLQKLFKKETVIKEYLYRIESAKDTTADYVSILNSLDKKLLAIDHLTANSIEAIHSASEATRKLDLIEQTNEEIAKDLESNVEEDDEKNSFESNEEFTKILQECNAMTITGPTSVNYKSSDVL